MNLVSQSSRMMAMFIKLKNTKEIDEQEYKKYCEYAIQGNHELVQLYTKYEQGLSEAVFLKSLRLIVNDKQDLSIELFLQNQSAIKQGLKGEFKQCFTIIKKDLNVILDKAFTTQSNVAESTSMVQVMMRMFGIQKYHLIKVITNDRVQEISETLDIRENQIPDYKVPAWIQKQPAGILFDKSNEQSIFKQAVLPQYYIRHEQHLLFFTLDEQSEQYQDYFISSQLYKRCIQIIEKGSILKQSSKVMTTRLELLYLISFATQVTLYKLIYLFTLAIAKLNKISTISFNTPHNSEEQYILLVTPSEIAQSSLKIFGFGSILLKQKIESLFIKSVKQYRKKLQQRQETINNYQKISQFNENIMMLFFDKYLQLYYLTTQWNNDQFVEKYSLRDKLKFLDPVYKVFERNNQIIASITELIESDNDHFECTDSLQKYSLQVSRGKTNKVKHLSVYLFNLHIKRPIAELMKRFRTKVRLLQNLRQATNAFRSKQLVFKNEYFRNSQLVMYLSDHDLRKINGANEAKFITASVEKIKIQNIKEKIKIVEKLQGKLVQLTQFKPDHSIIEDNPELCIQLADIKYNLLDINTIDDRIEIVYNLFRMCEYEKSMPMPKAQFCNFMTLIRHKYNKRQNPFHNFIHGVQVMHGCYVIAHNEKIGTYLNNLQKFVLTLSGLCHDVHHTGATNLFEINAQTKLAIRYNDRSVLEMHHISQTYKVLELSECDLLAAMSKSDKILTRKYFISNILHTDNKSHFTLLNDFEIKLGQSTTDNKIFESEENMMLLCGFIIHSADFSGAVKPYPIARAWSDKLKMEFQSQSKMEEIIGIPQTPYLKNLDNEVQFAKNEAGFLKVIVKPLWDTLNQFTNGHYIDQVRNICASIKKYEEIAEGIDQ